ncbi:MAG: hypothetical protein K1X85_01490 [Ignavibacteria bacterium]|nr:hypothetical protein [Ignavibacteria bacterium]
MKGRTPIALLLSCLVASSLANAGAVTGSRNKCFPVVLRYDARASVTVLSIYGPYTYNDPRRHCSLAISQVSANGGSAYARVGNNYPPYRSCVSKWNAIAGQGYRIPETAPPDSFGVSKGDNGETVTFDSAGHSIVLSDLYGSISATLGTNYGSTLLYVVWVPDSQTDSVINENEVLSRSKVSIESGQLVTDGIFSSTDFDVTIVPDSTGLLADFTVTPVSSLSKVINIDTSVSLDSVAVTVFCEGGYGAFHEEDIILPEEWTLSLSMFIEGMYVPDANRMTAGDTVTAFLRDHLPPYEILDSAVTLLDSSGNAFFRFHRDSPSYPSCCKLLTVKHRNSVETWSAGPIDNGSHDLVYDLTHSASSAFGNNLVQVDNSPPRFAVYSGDTDGDGAIDGSDVSAVDNDAANFSGGYLVTDLTGDRFVDGTDFLIADNNAANFIGVIRP